VRSIATYRYIDRQTDTHTDTQTANKVIYIAPINSKESLGAQHSACLSFCMHVCFSVC